MARKNCRNCSKEFEVIHYGRSGGKGVGARFYCSYKCQKRYNSRKYYNKEYYWERHIKRAYGITTEDYNKMFEQQNGCCAICNKHQSEIKKRLDIDHCHKTNKVRMLLCNPCNNLLGHSKDNPFILRAAARYLEMQSE